MWLASRTSAGEIVVYHSDSPYGTWSGPVVLETGVIGNDDISMVTAIPNGTIGVFWGNENASVRRFGFRVHVDGDPVSTWSVDEVPASQSAIDGVGTGMADDHMNFAVASDSTIYVAVKTSYDTSGYPKIALLVRRPNGIWDDLYPVDEAGTRPLVLLDEVHGFLSYIYTSAEGNNPIVYQQSSTASIAFDGRKTLRAGSYNDVSSMKATYNSEFVVIYGNGSEVAGQVCLPTDLEGAELAITKTDGRLTVLPDDELTYTVSAVNNGPLSAVGATVTDNLPAALTGVSWTCAGSGGGTCPASGSGDITSTVNLPVGASVTFTVTATVDALATGEVVNTASITAPEGVTDPLPANNTATDSDTIAIPGNPCESDPTLVGCWQMEENGGSVLIDGSSYNNDAVLTGAPAWITGKVGSYALDLNGTSQYATVADDTTLDLTNQLTLASWIKPEQYATQDIIKKAAQGSTNGYELTLATTKTDASSQRVFFRINQATNGDTYRINATTEYPIDGSWMHAAATYDGTTMKLYINGVLESSMEVPGGAVEINTLPLTIGAQDGTTASRWFMGWLDEARVYNRALSLAEIQVLAGISTNQAPIVTDIPNQTIAEGASFATINLDNFVSDVDNSDTEMTWSYSGNSELSVNIDVNRVATIIIPNADWHGAETITFKATDPGTLFGEDVAIFTVTNENDAPTDIALLGNTIEENLPVGTAIGSLTTTDIDISDTFTYSLVTGDGDTGNASFEISGDQLLSNESFNFEVQSSYSIRVRTTDLGGLFFDKIFTITVLDINDVPVAFDQEVSTEAETPLDITLIALDDDGDGLTWYTTSPSHGILTGSGANLTYTPSPGYTGADSFTFLVFDGLNWSNTATVTINVLEPVIFYLYMPLINK